MAMELVTDINMIGDMDSEGLATIAIAAGLMVNNDGGAVTGALAAVSGQDIPCTGFSPFAVAAGEAVTQVREGVVKGASGLTAGLPVHLGETIGTVQTAAPVGGGKVVQIVGLALSTTSFAIQIDPTCTTL